MRRILVTGANKGIGEQIVRKILKDHTDTYVYLGTRNLARGENARNSIISDMPDVSSRIEVLCVDVSDDSSVR